jgi:collagenase-like PrtC family protease
MSSKLKFSVGYQLPDLRTLSCIVNDYAADIEEVYFPWIGVMNGRGSSITGADEQQIMEKELEDIHAHGVKLNMLWNANCYGKDSISVELENKIESALSYMLNGIGLEAVTTASLFIASYIKRRFPEIEVRASVNMGIGSLSAMRCVRDYFDSFYVKRELNRFPSKIKVLKEWCVANDKRLYLLANSGCMKECPAHIFHDNLVAHEREIACEKSSWNGFRGICWEYFFDPANHYAFLADSTWIRPEEIDSYCGLVDGIKLATRVHRDPEWVISSYVKRAFEGNTLSLAEPDFSKLCYLDNTAFHDDWLERFCLLSESEREIYCKDELKHVRR